MNVYLVERWPRGSAQPGEVAGSVIAADTAGAARRIAAQHAGPEGVKTWRDATLSTCKLLPVGAQPRMMLRAVAS